MQPLDIRIFTAFEGAKTVWREAEGAADLHIYQTYDWLAGWYRLVGAARGVEPCLIAVHDSDGPLLMLLPLAIEPGRLWRKLVWMGAEFFDYHAPVLMPGASVRLQSIGIEAVWKAIRQKLPRIDYADFERQPELIGEQVNPLLGHAALACTHSAHHTDLVGDWSAYYLEKRGRRTRHNDRRKRKKLEQLGDLNFVVARSRADIDRLIPAMIRQKRAYVEALGKGSLLEQPGYRDFLCQLAEQGLMDGSVMLCSLDLDGDILAVQWGGVRQRRLYSIIASYDQGKHRKLSPGDVLLRDLLGWCFDQDIETFDFTYGDEPYKEAWCEHHVPLYRSLVAITAWGAVRAYPQRWLMELKCWAKNKQWLAVTYARALKLIYGA